MLDLTAIIAALVAFAVTAASGYFIIPYLLCTLWYFVDFRKTRSVSYIKILIMKLSTLCVSMVV